MTYHNSLPERGSTLRKYEDKAKTQQKKILAIFEFFNTELSPEQVHAHFDNTPLTSIRRAITDLSEGSWYTDPDDMHNQIYEPGKLVMTGNKVKGKYGRMINTWKLNK